MSLLFPSPRLSAALVPSLLIVVLAAWLVPLWSLQATLQREQAAFDQATVQQLAQAWAPLQNDPEALRGAAEARWSSGQDARLLIHSATGRQLLKLERPRGSLAVPDWFTECCALQVPDAPALLKGGGVVLQLQTAHAQRDGLLWAVAQRSLLGLGTCLGLVALSAMGLRLGPRFASAGAVQGALPGASAGEGADSPATTLKVTLATLRADFERQAEMVARLQQQVQTDLLTGLHQRDHFLHLLQRRLDLPPGAQAALLLVRVPDLAALNLRLGHAQADRALGAVAQVLLTYVDRVPGAVAGRLNGSDFALALPVTGMAAETAASLRVALAASPLLRATRVDAVVGGVDALPAMASSQALAEADAALARAEAGEGGGVLVERHGDLLADAAGAEARRAQIAAALVPGRAQLDAHPVCDRDGRVLHQLCHLSLQLQPGGPFEPARSWAALARRGRLLPQVEQLTLRLALAAIAADGQVRAVRLAAPSLYVPGFVTEVQRLLQAEPLAARRLAVELAETESLGEPQVLAAALATWQGQGVKLGLLHNGTTPLALLPWQALGVRFVTLSAQPWSGLAHDAALKAYAASLLTLTRSLGLVVTVDAVANASDLSVLWTLGLDGAQCAASATAPGVAAAAAPGLEPDLQTDLQPTSPTCRL